MFGYIRPCKPELRVREFEMYRGVYCSLCRRIGRLYGLAARLTLSYDCTFLGLLALSMEKDCQGFHKGRCGVNPLKRCTYIKTKDDRLDYAATVSVLLTYFNLKDNLTDKGWLRRMAAVAVLPFLHFPVRKIIKQNRSLYDMVAQAMTEQSDMEQSGTASVDEAAHPTAHLLEQVFAGLAEAETQRKVLSRLGYYIGRWVYLVDAADDRADDRKKGNYNPFLAADSSGQQIRETLTLTLNRAIAGFDLLTVYHYHDILQNILVLGLPGVQQDICNDKGE